MSSETNDVVSILSKAVIALSPPTFLFLRYVVAAPYGKHAPRTDSTASRSFGPAIDARIGWTVFESPNLLWSAWCFHRRDAEIFTASNATLLSMFVVHYVNRSVLYPMRLSSQSRPVSLAVVASGWGYCMVNGYLQAMNLCRVRHYPRDHILSAHFLVGATMFLVGFGINLQSDAILRNLKSGKNGDASSYKIPRGGAFEWVSCGNYFGEVVEWAGYCLASGWSLPATSFFLFTCANLVPRALSSHEWYRDKFDDYPGDRKAILPFIL